MPPARADLLRIARAAQRYRDAVHRLEQRGNDWRYLLDDPLHEEVLRARQALFEALEAFSPLPPSAKGERKAPRQQLALFLPRRPKKAR